MPKKPDPLPIPPTTWEIVDFRPEPSGTGLVAVYLEVESGATVWTSVVGWLGYAASGDVSPVRRWGAGVLYSDFPEVGPAWNVADGQVYLGIFDPTSRISFDEWVAAELDELPHAEPWRVGDGGVDDARTTA